jgi:hypothetical protein
MKARSFIAVLGILAVLAITGCSNPESGTGGDRVSVAVDTSVPAISDNTTLAVFTGSYPASDAAVVDFILDARQARRSAFNFLNYINQAGGGVARMAAPESKAESSGGGFYESNYKVQDRNIYVAGYANSASAQSYRDEDGFKAGDTETESSDSAWSTIYDRESFTYNNTDYQLDGKVVSTYSGNSNGTFETVLSNGGYVQAVNYSDSSHDLEAFSISNGTTALKYSLDITVNQSGSYKYEYPPTNDDDDDDWPLIPTPAQLAEYFSGISVSFIVYDGTTEKINKHSGNGYEDQLWLVTYLWELASNW